VRTGRVWARLLGVEKTTVQRVEFDEITNTVVVHVRPHERERRRCPMCRRRCAVYDSGDGRRRWRALDLGTVLAEIEAAAPRVFCPEHGVLVAAVPWARHRAGHTREFDETVAWLAVSCSKSAVSELMRIAWRTVGSIITRVWADIEARVDRFAGLARIGIDEISYKRGHRYLTVVVDHDARRLVWAAPGRDKATLRAFFDVLGTERSAAITHVSADAADWIADVVAERAPNAIRCADAFHVVAWATDALDEVRRQAWNEARGAVTARRAPRATGEAKALKAARYALWKNPENLTEHQATKLEWIAATNPKLYRAYLLKEGLRLPFKLKGQAGKEALDRWLSWAARCRIPVFVALGKKIRKHRAAINAALEHDLSNALIESTNTKIRLLQRIAFGFRSADALVALAMLSLGGFRPSLPNRTAHG
jgi:transposase